MTADRYSRLFELVTAGAGHLALEGDDRATADAGELMSELAHELPPVEADRLVGGMLDFEPFRGASVPPVFHPDVIAFGGR